jgi:hypothetical protein
LIVNIIAGKAGTACDKSIDSFDIICECDDVARESKQESDDTKGSYAVQTIENPWKNCELIIMEEKKETDKHGMGASLIKMKRKTC